MASFSLTHPPRDPHIGPRQPGADYADLALSRWLDARIIAHDLNECRQHARGLSVRIENGRTWMRSHDVRHPRFQHNKRRLMRLEWTLTEQAIRYRALQINGWSACCTTYAMLQHLTPLEREAWWREYGNDAGGYQKPLDVWRAAGFQAVPPSGWPPDREGWEWEGYSGWGLMPRQDEWLEEMQT